MLLNNLFLLSAAAKINVFRHYIAPKLPAALDKAIYSNLSNSQPTAVVYYTSENESHAEAVHSLITKTFGELLINSGGVTAFDCASGDPSCAKYGKLGNALLVIKNPNGQLGNDSVLTLDPKILEREAIIKFLTQNYPDPFVREINDKSIDELSHDSDAPALAIVLNCATPDEYRIEGTARFYFNHWVRSGKSVVDHFKIDRTGETSAIDAKLGLKSNETGCTVTLFDKRENKVVQHSAYSPTKNSAQMNELFLAVEKNKEEWFDISFSQNRDISSDWRLQPAPILESERYNSLLESSSTFLNNQKVAILIINEGEELESTFIKRLKEIRASKQLRILVISKDNYKLLFDPQSMGDETFAIASVKTNKKGKRFQTVPSTLHPSLENIREHVTKVLSGEQDSLPVLSWKYNPDVVL